MARPGDEHFVTLFDAFFLPQGLALHRSLLRHCPHAVLWVLAMDEAVERHLKALALPRLRVVALVDVETPALLAVKVQRTRGEYCWTMTPWVFRTVFDQDPSARRATYLDADVAILSDPVVPLEEMAARGQSVLITPHAYAPQYADFAEHSGIYCVQFLTVVNNPEGLAVVDRWRDQCLEWCFARKEPGRFGDQMYLDTWPRDFPCVHVVDDPWRFLGPWNHRHAVLGLGRRSGFVTYHFHGLRCQAGRRIQVNLGYRLGPGFQTIARNYLQDLGVARRLMAGVGAPWPVQAPLPGRWQSIKDVLKQWLGMLHLAQVPEV